MQTKEQKAGLNSPMMQYHAYREYTGSPWVRDTSKGQNVGSQWCSL